MTKVINVSYYSYITKKRQSISLFVIEEYKKSYLVNHPYYGEIEVMKDGSGNDVRLNHNGVVSEFERLILGRVENSDILSNAEIHEIRYKQMEKAFEKEIKDIVNTGNLLVRQNNER